MADGPIYEADKLNEEIIYSSARASGCELPVGVQKSRLSESIQRAKGIKQSTSLDFYHAALSRAIISNSYYQDREYRQKPYMSQKMPTKEASVHEEMWGKERKNSK